LSFLCRRRLIFFPWSFQPSNLGNPLDLQLIYRQVFEKKKNFYLRKFIQTKIVLLAKKLSKWFFTNNLDNKLKVHNHALCKNLYNLYNYLKILVWRVWLQMIMKLQNIVHTLF
jgi:hypothetical protein